LNKLLIEFEVEEHLGQQLVYEFRAHVFFMLFTITFAVGAVVILEAFLCVTGKITAAGGTL
jgi:NAD/NADP transhydrogenase alpha subunit